MCLPAAVAAIPSLFTGAGAAAGSVGTLAKIGMAAQGVAGVVGAAGAINQGNIAAAEAKANSKAQSEAAMQALAQGSEESSERFKEGRKLLARQRAVMAANGVDVNSDQALDILDDTRTDTTEDAYAIRTNAARQADGFRQQQANYSAAASAAKTSSRYQAAGTLLSTASSVSRRWAQYGMGEY